MQQVQLKPDSAEETATALAAEGNHECKTTAPTMAEVEAVVVIQAVHRGYLVSAGLDCVSRDCVSLCVATDLSACWPSHLSLGIRNTRLSIM